MTASLRLIPISKEECISLLVARGKTSLDDHEWLFSLAKSAAAAKEAYKQHRIPITLKLCSNRLDIIDVDDESVGSIEPETVKYASKYQDGSIMAIVTLGRNFTTGIKLAIVSRGLADVTLANASATGKKKAAMLDLATPGVKPAAADASYTSGESRSSINDGALVDGKNEDPSAKAVALLSMRKHPGKHAVYVDGDIVNKPLGGEIPLENGSIISLYGPAGFAYKVSILQGDAEAAGGGGSANLESSSPKKRKANPPGEQKEKSPVRAKPPSAHDDNESDV